MFYWVVIVMVVKTIVMYTQTFLSLASLLRITFFFLYLCYFHAIYEYFTL